MKQSSFVKRLTFSVMLILLSSLGLFTGTVLAADYLGTGQFPVRQLRWEYMGISTGHESNADTSMGRWHTQTDLNLIKVTSNQDIRFIVHNYGNTGWTGYAYICDTLGNCSNQTAWDNTYNHCEARINHTDTSSLSDTKKQNVFMHEAGHCFSLGHRWTGIMWPFVRSYNSLNSTDKQLINARY